MEVIGNALGCLLLLAWLGMMVAVVAHQLLKAGHRTVLFQDGSAYAMAILRIAGDAFATFIFIVGIIFFFSLGGPGARIVGWLIALGIVVAYGLTNAFQALQAHVIGNAARNELLRQRAIEENTRHQQFQRGP